MRKRQKSIKKSSRRLAKSAKPTIGYIISPKIDFWMTGGVSILVMSMVLLYIGLNDIGATTPNSPFLGAALLLGTLINWPHFMGAYSLIYRPSGNIKKYKSATIYIPIALLFAILISVITGENSSESTTISVNQDFAYFIWLGAAFYLAWHYTGQAWGMIATYAKLSNLKLKQNERRVLRFGLRILLVWHVVWGAQDLPAHWFGGILSAHIEQLMWLMNITACTAFITSFLVWYNIKQTTGKIPDKRIIASWLSIYMWYLVLYFMPEAYLLVLASHALQYLPFPLRVEMNKTTPATNTTDKMTSILWGARYYVILVICGIVVFYFPEYLSSKTEPFTLAIVIASAVSIHHYFIDSCIWRISNADVKESLFSHLK
jgi:hypothetical protein